MAKVKNEENYFLCPPQTRIQKSMKVGPYLFCSVLCPRDRCTCIAVSIRLMSSCICAWLTVGSCQLTNKGQMVVPWKNLEKGPWNAYVSLLWVQSPTVLYPVGTGHRSRNRRRGGSHTKQVSVFMGTNEFHEIISDADMQVCSLHTRHKETHQECIYAHPTGIPSEGRQGRRQTPTLALSIHSKPGH